MKDAATLMRAVASAQKYDNVSKKACLDDFKVIMFWFDMLSMDLVRIYVDIMTQKKKYR